MSTLTIRIGDGTASVTTERAAEGRWQVHVEGVATPASVERIAPGVFRVVIDGCADIVYVTRGTDWWAFSGGHAVQADISTEARRPARSTDPHRGHQLRAPMPARVIRIAVMPGARVAKGDTLVVLEAMKMQLAIRTPADGIVAAVHCTEGELVPTDHLLIEVA